jgi:PIN domain nuclease of toxin-antitoxin system
VKLLVDSHALIWALDDPAKLSMSAVAALQDLGNQPLISAATIWEISIKVGKDRLKLSLSYRVWMNKAIAELGAKIVPISVQYAEAQAMLPPHHGDPFDRLMVAQALVKSIPIVSSDTQLDLYGVTRIW